jgi:hypothetical protein
MTKYIMAFENETDMHIRAALNVLYTKGYPAGISLGGDGNTWFYDTDKPIEIDTETKNKLNEIGVQIIERC